MAETVELPTNNLYVTGKLLRLSATEVVLSRRKISLNYNIKDSYYLVKETDRLDTISYKYYSSFHPDAGKLWWVIADVNNINNPLDISELVGKTIVVPDFSRVKLAIK